MLSGQRLAMTFSVLVAVAGRNAWLGFVASTQVRKLVEDNRKVEEGEEVRCAA